jgi:hypothetical protein
VEHWKLYKTVSKELYKYMSDLIRVLEVRWEGGSTKLTYYTFFYRKENENYDLGIGFSVHKKIISEQSLLVIGCHA